VGYANRGLNFPVLTSAKGGHDHGTITGSLLTRAGTYQIEFFASPTCDPSGNGEGAYYIGALVAPTGNVGSNGQFLAPISFQTGFVDFASIPFITATAADAVGNTSELSACIHYVDDTVFANGFE
jgi:titin